MKIQIVIPLENRGWIYPILKWRKDLKAKGIVFDIFSRPSFSAKNKPDVVILTSRYYRSLFKTNSSYFEGIDEYALNDIARFRELGSNIVFYDLSASTGSRELHLVKHVDAFWKRQVMKDKFFYTQSNVKYRIWVEGEETEIIPCSKSDVEKIRLGWNLGYHDFKSYLLPIHRLGIYFHDNPVYNAPSFGRPITCGYRGTISGSRTGQRQQVMETLKEMSAPQFLIGPVISKSKYLTELTQSKSVVSPFGYGEICYRDMEAFVKGAILLKPSLEHLATFPNIFIENETYIPILWDLSDFKEKLLAIDKNYPDFHHIAIRGQNLYKELYESFEVFYDHFEKEVRKVAKF
jgi:hypothetical protein